MTRPPCLWDTVPDGEYHTAATASSLTPLWWRLTIAHVAYLVVCLTSPS